MPEIFENHDFTDSTFWGVRFHRAKFRDADFSGSTFFHVLLSDVSIDGEIKNLVVNGVDVTDYVNNHDRWWPLRTKLAPDSVDGLVESWTELAREWSALLDRVARVDPAVVSMSINGEWTLSETLRHLVFAMDKWFTMPILGKHAYSAIGLPHSSAQQRLWPGLNLSASPSFAEILATRAAQHEVFRDFVSMMNFGNLPESVSVEENGDVPTTMCFHVVLEEEFEHLRYMIRDLAELGVG